MKNRLVSGFTYLGILFAIAIMGAVLAATGVIWSHSIQREKERELIHIGNQLRRAISLYYERTPGVVKRYPSNLEDLLHDTRHLALHRYLRRVYTDPMTGKEEWGYVKAPDGGIMGIHSLSNDRPIKIGNFSRMNDTLSGATRYSDWQFVYVPFTGPSQGIKPSI